MKFDIKTNLLSIAIICIVLFTVNQLVDDTEEKKVVKLKVDGTRIIHQLIKTKTGTEVIEYAENYMGMAASLISRNDEMHAARQEDEIPWIERGPGNVGGRTRTILVDRADPSEMTWLIGTAGGGIWKTSDEGVNWSNVSPFFPNLSVVTLVQGTQNLAVIYAGTGEGGLGGNYVNGVGIFKSLDGGNSWLLLGATANSMDFLNTNRILVHPKNENIVFAATSNGVQQQFTSAIMRSDNGGDSWVKVFEAPSRVQQILFDPIDPDLMYASLTRFGVIKSLDGGASWVQTPLESTVTAGGNTTERTELAIAPSNSNKIYASVSYLSRSGSGLYWSQNKGDTWTEVKNPDDQDIDFLVQGEYNNSIVVSPSNENNVFFGGVNLYEASITDGQSDLSDRDFIGVDQEGTSGFLSFVSFNSGTHFNNSFEIPNPTNTPNLEIRFGAKSQKAHRFNVPEGRTSGVADEDYSYMDYVDVPFEVWDVENERQLMVSFRDQQRDGTFNLNLPNLDDQESINREYLYIHNLNYDSENPNSKLTVNGGQTIDQYVFIWPTLANGTWDPNGLPSSILRINFGSVSFQIADIKEIEGNNSVHPDHHFLTFTSNGKLISVNDGGVAFSIDRGETFVERETGLVTSQYYSADKKPGESLYIGGTQDNDVNLSLAPDPISTSEYDDNAFDDFFADGFEVVWNRDGTRILASNQHNFIFRTDDGGDNWKESTEGLDDSDIFGEDDDTPFFTKLSYSKYGPDRVFAVSSNGVWRSEDFGESWGLRRIGNWGGFLDVEVSDVNVDVIWAGGALDQNRKIHLSTDGGLTFLPVSNYELDPSKGNITTIVPHPNDERSAYLVFSQAGVAKILKTNDFGQTWKDLTGFENGISLAGFPDVGVFSLLVFPDDNRIWAGTEIGVFETLNGGESWGFLDSELPAVAVWDFKVVNGEVVTATHGRGIWTADLDLNYENVELQTVLSSNATGEDVPVVFPNPTTGTFQIKGLMDIKRLEVFNLSGALILEDEVRVGDVIRIDQGGGVYFLKMYDDNNRFYTKKLVIQ